MRRSISNLVYRKLHHPQPAFKSTSNGPLVTAACYLPLRLFQRDAVQSQ